MSALDPKVAEQHHRKTRIVSVVAATAISLACGTNVSRLSKKTNKVDGNRELICWIIVCVLSLGAPVR